VLPLYQKRKHSNYTLSLNIVNSNLISKPNTDKHNINNNPIHHKLKKQITVDSVSNAECEFQFMIVLALIVGTLILKFRSVRI
jgi:hypothetical protein